MSGTAITGERVATALVAACKVTGVAPTEVFGDGHGGGRTRVMAAAACVARLGWSRGAAARVFRIHRTRLTPSGLEIARVTTEHLLTVAEALREAGLCGDGTGGPPVSPPPAVAAETPRRKTGAGAAISGKTRTAATVATDRLPASQASPRRRPAPPARASSRPTAAVTRIKAVTPRIVRWTRQQLALGADLDFVADCFDVDPSALAAAVAGVEPQGMAA